MRVGQTRRRDQNEKPIVKAWRAVGAHVTLVSGKGAPDALVRLASQPRGLCYGFEIKSAIGQQTDAQEETDWPIVRSIDDALRAIGVIP